MKTIAKILMVIGTAVLYKYMLMNFTFSGNAFSMNSIYIFREIVGYALMFQIVPSVIVKVWNK